MKVIDLHIFGADFGHAEVSGVDFLLGHLDPFGLVHLIKVGCATQPPGFQRHQRECQKKHRCSQRDDDKCPNPFCFRSHFPREE